MPNIQSFNEKTIQKVYAYGVRFVKGNSVDILWRGEETFQIIIDSLRMAKKIICLEFYIFRNDETGCEIAEILKEKARNGVNVYVLYDHFGSFGTPIKFWNKLKEAGVRIRASRPFKLSSPFEYIYRDHKKLIVIDGELSFTGGLNIANEYRGYKFLSYRFKGKEGWRDTGIILKGPISMALFDIFKKSWLFWKGEQIDFYADVKPYPQGVSVIPIFASSAKGRRKMRKLFYYSLLQAKKSIYLTTAYFTPSRRMMHVLRDAVSRGVDVRIILPGISDVPAASYAGRAYYANLLKAGVRIYHYIGTILHAKTSVFDGVWSIIGSANLDFQSLRRNDEGNVGIISEEFGKKMIDIFNDDIKHSEEITLEKWVNRPFIEKVKEKFFALFRRRL